MKLILLIITSFTLFGVATTSRADELANLEAYFQKKLESAQESVCAQPSAQANPDQMFQDVNVDLVSDMSFGIPSVLNFTISPELDLVFTPHEKK